MNRPSSNGEQLGVLGRALGWLRENAEMAVMSVPKNVSVSHDAFGCVDSADGKLPELTCDNHAWWIGKIPKTKKERSDGIYSLEFIQASLEVLFKNLGEGEVAQIVMAPSFSRYFNGREDRERGLSNEDAKALILEVVVKKFPQFKDRLNVVCVEEMDLHKDLFDELGMSIDPYTGVCDVEMAFEIDGETYEKYEFDISKSPTSLNIARFLYRVSKENKDLFQVLRHAVPGKIRSDFDENPSAKDYYALTEIAIRLAEILNGRSIHGGADRQGKYDDFIEDIIVAANPKEGKSARKKTMLVGLEPLIELFKGKRFETLHLDTGKNPHKMKVDRKVARTRLALAGVLSAVAIVLPKIGIDVASEVRRRDNVSHGREMIMKMVDQALKGRCLTHDDCKFGVSSENSFKWILNECLYQISIRYSIPHDQVLEIENSLLGFVLSHQDFLARIGSDNSSLIEFVDTFMNDPVTRVKLVEVGVKDPKVYGQLSDYDADFVEMAKGIKQKRSVSGENGRLENCQQYGPASSINCKCTDVKPLGVFSPSSMYSNERYNLSVCKGRNGDVLLAEQDYSFGDFVPGVGSTFSERLQSWYFETFKIPKRISSTKLVEDQVAKGYLDTMRKAEMAKIPDRIKVSLSELCNLPNSIRLSNFDFSKASIGPEYVNSKFVHKFKDPFDNEGWDLVMSSDCQKFGDKLFCEEFVLAKKAGENTFTFARAQEFAQKYMNVMHSHWSYSTECKN